jgi:hypothetical protein
MKRHLLAILFKCAEGLAWALGFVLGLVAVGYAAYKVLVAYDVLKI